MNIYNYILFDWDGCLADTPGVWMDVYLRLYKAAGLQVEIKDVIEKSWGNLELGPKNFGISNPEKFWQRIVAEVGEDLKTVTLYKDVKKLLKQLKLNNKKIAIVTSSPAKLVAPALEHHNLNQYIDILISSDDVTNEKPDPEMLFLALEKMDAEDKVGETIIIGDTGKDILAGQNAGMDQILVLHEANKKFYDFDKLRVSQPTYVVESLKELKEIIL